MTRTLPSIELHTRASEVASSSVQHQPCRAKRKEVELATTEMTAKAKKAATGAGIAAAGGALVHAGVLVFLATIVIALAQVGVSPWLSALIVAIVTMAGGYLLVSSGVEQMRRTTVTPTRAIEELKETATWTRRQGA
jgi:Flp pilus assembly protein TadB